MEASQQPTTEQLLQQILKQQEEHRQEVAKLREQYERPVVQAASATPLSPEDALAARLQEVEGHSHYCPACGLLYDYPQRCHGKAESGHPPVEVISTDELKSGDPSQHSTAVYV